MPDFHNEEVADPAVPGVVAEKSVLDFPEGYRYGVTRYADVILKNAFPKAFQDLSEALNRYRISYPDEILNRGGNRTPQTRRFDESLYRKEWRKHRVTIGKYVDNVLIFQTRTHEIDVFKKGKDDRYPGVAVEMEWNNKDPFFHLDLNNFSGLHREGVIAVGVIVTRGPELQEELEERASLGEFAKSIYGRSTTHWDKLLPIVNLGGGGECPLLLVGIEKERVSDWPRDNGE